MLWRVSTLRGFSDRTRVYDGGLGLGVDSRIIGLVANGVVLRVKVVGVVLAVEAATRALAQSDRALSL